MAHLTYKGHTDIYVPFPKIAFKKPNGTFYEGGRIWILKWRKKYFIQYHTNPLC